MPRVFKAVQLAFNEPLPEHLRDYARPLDTKDVNKVLTQIAVEAPDSYSGILSKMADLGRNASWRQGETVRLSDFKPLIDKDAALAMMEQEIDAARKVARTDSEFKKAREQIWLNWSKKIESETMREGIRRGNNLAYAVASGARGKADHLKLLTATPGVYTDSNDKLIPLFIRHSYGEGLSPAEYWAATYGARKSVTATKRATAKGGFLGKTMVQAAAPVVVTMQDCGTSNGIRLDPETDDLRFRVLAADANGYPAGTILDRDASKPLRKSGKPVMVRSLMTCQAPEGVCAKCAGAGPDGKLPPKGEAVGITGVQAISEPIVQNALNCLHEETRVRMADFSVKRIRDIVPGESVLGADVQGNTFPVKVLAVHDQGIQPVQRYTYAHGEHEASVICTTEHPILQIDLRGDKKPQKRAAGVAVGEPAAVLSCQDSDSYKIAKRVTIEPLGEAHCFDLSVDHPDELFVLENSLIVKNTKHLSGMGSGKKELSGFDVLNRFLQTPENFPERAEVAEEEGLVEKIEPAPQGGTYVTVAGKPYYIRPDLEVTVKVGDSLEPGDALSDGAPDPYDIVRLRGLGEGRAHYVKWLDKILANSGMKADRRNLEALARGALDHVQITDVEARDGALPGDSVRYSRHAAMYRPPEDLKPVPLQRAKGLRLHKPVMHYTIGTRLTKRMLDDLQDAGVTEVLASDDDTGFEPEMVRLQTAGAVGDDWLAKQHTSYLKGNLVDSAVRGEDTNVKENVHFVPRLAYGEGFGEKVRETGKF